MATWAMAMASPALTPSQGAAEAWAALPVKVTSKWDTARQVASSRSSGQGWTIMAAWTSSNTPCSSMVTLPPPPSSAGVPEHPHGDAELVGHPGQTRARPRPPTAAMMLCPQAWPTPGRASYSAQTATTIGPDPSSALKAVGRPATPVVTANPPSASASDVQAQARSSSKAVSGWSWMVWLSRTRSASSASMASRAASFERPGSSATAHRLPITR